MLPATVPVVIARVPVVVVREVEVQPLPHRGAAVFAKTRVFLTCRWSCQDAVPLVNACAFCFTESYAPTEAV